jgi:hypothetical protein
MHSDSQYQTDKTSSFDDFKNVSLRFITFLCIVLAAIISSNYLYFVLTGQINVKFNLVSTIISILIHVFLFLVSLVLLQNIKDIRKLIQKTDWKMWRYKGKYRFAFSVAFRFLSYAIVLLAISNYIMTLFNDYDVSSDGATILNILLPAFLAGLSIAVNAWNIKMEERNTLRNKLFSTRLY